MRLVRRSLRPAEQVDLVRSLGRLAEAETRGPTQDIGVLVELAPGGGDDVAILIGGERHDLVHLLDPGAGQAGDRVADVVEEAAHDAVAHRVEARPVLLALGLRGWHDVAAATVTVLCVIAETDQITSQSTMMDRW